MVVATAPTMNPFNSFPMKKTRFVVAINSMATATNEMIKAPASTFFRPIQSASSAEIRDETTALDGRCQRNHEMGEILRTYVATGAPLKADCHLAGIT